jgi:HEAT repeat protein
MSEQGTQVGRWLSMMPLPDNPKQTTGAEAKLAGSWGEWIAEGKQTAGIEGALAEILRNETDAFTRSRAALALGFVGGKSSVNNLIDTLASDIPAVQFEAAAALGRIGDPESIEPLCEALRNPDANVRANASMALGKIGGQRALECLKIALADQDTFVQGAVKEALKQAG